MLAKASGAEFDTAWVDPPEPSIGQPIDGATAGGMLFVGPGGVLTQDNRLVFDPNTGALAVGGPSTAAAITAVSAGTSAANRVGFWAQARGSSANNFAFLADADGDTGDNFAGVFRATGLTSGTNYGFQAAASGGGDNIAGYFIGRLVVDSNTTNHPTVIITARAGQAADLQHWRDSTGAVLSAIDKDGHPIIPTFDGVPTTAPAASGALALDKTNNRLYVTTPTGWKYVQLG